MKKKLSVLILISHYYPGFKYGGPIKTIFNLVKFLGNDFEFKIICSDRDFADTKPYPNIKKNAWHRVGNADVFYVSKLNLNLKFLCKLINETKHDVLHLNGLFDFNFTIKPIILKRLGLINCKFCIIAPRGQLALTALKIKKIKKYFFLFLAKVFKLYDNLYWHASSAHESKDISREFHNLSGKIKTVPDLIDFNFYGNQRRLIKKNNLNEFKLIFLSRITPIKNLDFLLKVLIKVKSKVSLDIYGPQESNQFFKTCVNLIKMAPPNIKIKYKKELKPNKVLKIFSNYDLFVFPTKGESFGYVILEALIAGTPVLLSNKTSWKEDPLGGLKIIKLNLNYWIKEIEYRSQLDRDKLLIYRLAALQYLKKLKKLNLKSLRQNKDFYLKFSKKIN